MNIIPIVDEKFINVNELERVINSNKLYILTYKSSYPQTRVVYDKEFNTFFKLNQDNLSIKDFYEDNLNNNCPVLGWTLEQPKKFFIINGYNELYILNSYNEGMYISKMVLEEVNNIITIINCIKSIHFLKTNYVYNY